MSLQLPPDLTKAVAAGGWPVAVLLVVIMLVIPKIDHGIAVADHVDSTLTRIEASCVLLSR